MAIGHLSEVVRLKGISAARHLTEHRRESFCLLPKVCNSQPDGETRSGAIIHKLLSDPQTSECRVKVVLNLGKLLAQNHAILQIRSLRTN